MHDSSSFLRVNGIPNVFAFRLALDANEVFNLTSFGPRVLWSSRRKEFTNSTFLHSNQNNFPLNGEAGADNSFHNTRITEKIVHTNIPKVDNII